MSLEKRKSFIINFSFFVLVAGLIYVVLKYLFGLVMPFLIGFLVALVLQKSINFFATKLRLPKKLVAVVLVVLFYATIGFLLIWLGISLFAELKSVVEKLPKFYSSDVEPVIWRVFEQIERLMARFDLSLVQLVEEFRASLTQSIGKLVSEISSVAIGTITSTVTAVPRMFVFVLLSIISSVFLAVDYTIVTEFLAKLVPRAKREVVHDLKGFSEGIGLKYVKAYVFLILITFTELAIGLSILRVEGALTIAALTALIDVLPVLGTGLVVLPWALFELIKGNLGLALGLSLLYLVITVVRNVLEPKLVGQQIGLHPIAMLLGMYVGVKLLGFIGLFALPFTILVIKYLYDNDKLHFDS